MSNYTRIRVLGLSRQIRPQFLLTQSNTHPWAKFQHGTVLKYSSGLYTIPRKVSQISNVCIAKNWVSSFVWMDAWMSASATTSHHRQPSIEYAVYEVRVHRSTCMLLKQMVISEVIGCSSFQRGNSAPLRRKSVAWITASAWNTHQFILHFNSGPSTRVTTLPGTWTPPHIQEQRHGYGASRRQRRVDNPFPRPSRFHSFLAWEFHLLLLIQFAESLGGAFCTLHRNGESCSSGRIYVSTYHLHSSVVQRWREGRHHELVTPMVSKTHQSLRLQIVGHLHHDVAPFHGH